jgi:hypothetical protein
MARDVDKGAHRDDGRSRWANRQWNHRFRPNKYLLIRWCNATESALRVFAYPGIRGVNNPRPAKYTEGPFGLAGARRANQVLTGQVPGHQLGQQEVQCADDVELLVEA